MNIDIWRKNKIKLDVSLVSNKTDFLVLFNSSVAPNFLKVLKMQINVQNYNETACTISR